MAEGRQEEEEYNSEVEEEQLAFLLGTEEVEEEAEEVGLALTARDEIQRWQKLRTQIKGQLQTAKERSTTLTEINQLLILRNFANLCIKGFGRMDSSDHIALEWHEGQGVHFARRIRNLARHYQKFQQLPPEKRGSSGSCSLFNDERVQRASRAYLTGLRIGDVTPKVF